ncbi:hypothetical protein [Patiriisocius hiemis]|uniref:Uncharacterized protein n=1 Tax=Patiriisocius hiemis TaxID=3075604 RepID=A0ABU2YFR0_9FLAO|nr:hypothetical protein [Constantimarinum sp. W242]MDT0556620.1 hypothetical protein [Constantimarinum sp. W242]
MQKKSFYKDLYILIPLLVSGFVAILLVFLLQQKVFDTPIFAETLKKHLGVFISISGFIAALILFYLVFNAFTVKNSKNSAINSLSAITQKMHDFRTIVELLYRSKMWLSGLKEYIDEEFEGLTFFDVKEFYKGKSKLAIEFLQEKNSYDETENLYLELKAILMTSPKDKRVSENIKYPQFYSKEIVSKWLEHKVGSGLWYFFGYKYGAYKDALDLHSVYERHQDKIMKLANKIDGKTFEDSSFNEVFLSKLGEYMSKEVIPKLYQFQDTIQEKASSKIVALYMLFLTMVFVGVLLPIAYLLFSLPIISIIISISVTVASLFLISLSIYPFIISTKRS